MSLSTPTRHLHCRYRRSSYRDSSLENSHRSGSSYVRGLLQSCAVPATNLVSVSSNGWVWLWMRQREQRNEEKSRAHTVRATAAPMIALRKTLTVDEKDLQRMRTCYSIKLVYHGIRLRRTDNPNISQNKEKALCLYKYPILHYKYFWRVPPFLFL